MKFSKLSIHKAFEIGLVLKGINGVIETIGGILLWSFDVRTIEHLFVKISLMELPRGPYDVFAHAIHHMAYEFDASAKMIGAIYLLSHGIFKVGLVLGLQFKKPWAYPVALGFLFLFISYQTYRLSHHFSWPLLFLTSLDTALMWLIYREHKAQRLQSKRANQSRLVDQPVATEN